MPGSDHEGRGPVTFLKAASSLSAGLRTSAAIDGTGEDNGPRLSNRKPRYRAARRRERRAQGITPVNRQYIWSVSAPTFLEFQPIYGLARVPGRIWLFPGAARGLLRGVKGCLVERFEFKRCELCHRPLVGSEATTYRKLLESGRNIPCGSTCDRDQSLKLWTRLA
jgi:hypothetical protein